MRVSTLMKYGKRHEHFVFLYNRKTLNFRGAFKLHGAFDYCPFGLELELRIKKNKSFPFTIWQCHMPPTSRNDDRIRQTSLLQKYIENLTETKVIVCGDFNGIVSTKTKSTSANLTTYFPPSSAGKKRYDSIFSNLDAGYEISVASQKFGSDHYPVHVRINFSA